jgi:hypothetical protein
MDRDITLVRAAALADQRRVCNLDFLRILDFYAKFIAVGAFQMAFVRLFNLLQLSSQY